mmetsp:Transcript_49864/g.154019  ORF Transcript_49864/g.154019 Transcript_49864/m.154019 type:complete len:167 (-) Transcript_49864:124-624(-)
MMIMDVGKEDLKVVFEILDSDRSGTVSYTEFVEQLHKMRCHESHTLLVFVKHYVSDVHRKVSEQLDLMKNDLLVKTTELFGQYEHQEAGIKRLMSFVRVGSQPGLPTNAAKNSREPPRDSPGDSPRELRRGSRPGTRSGGPTACRTPSSTFVLFSEQPPLMRSHSC